MAPSYGLFHQYRDTSIAQFEIVPESCRHLGLGMGSISATPEEDIRVRARRGQGVAGEEGEALEGGLL